MKKMILSAIGIAASLLPTAQADVFNVDVEINNVLGTTPIVITESQTMGFPIITINESSTEDTSCYATGVVEHNRYVNRSYGATTTSATSLCPNQMVPAAKVTISGTNNALITMTQTATPQVQSGFNFAINNKTISPRLSTSGTYTSQIDGTLTLVDKSAVTSGLLNFTYEVTAAYQ